MIPISITSPFNNNEFRQKVLNRSVKDTASHTLPAVAAARYHFTFKRKYAHLVDTLGLRLETWRRNLKEGALLELVE